MDARATLWLNDAPARRGSTGPGNVTLQGPPGSLWTTREERIAKGWPDIGEPENLYVVAEQPTLYEASVACKPRTHGEQAGLYAYASATSWVKLVVEGTGESVQLIFAEQHDAVPFIRGKKVLSDFNGSIDLKMTSDGTAFYRTGGRDWASVPRGLGWLTKDELNGRPYGSLEESDDRGRETAIANLPVGWRAVLGAEQWHDTEATIAFSNINYEVANV